MLLSEFLGAACGVVGNVGAECVEISDHAIERAAGADAFLGGDLLVGNAIFSVQFSPCALNDDIVECGSDP